MLDLIRAYENYLSKVKQASANTVASYMRDIRQFSEWLQLYEQIGVVDAEQLHIHRYIAHLQVDGRSGATLSRNLASLKNFYAYLVPLPSSLDRAILRYRHHQTRPTPWKADRFLQNLPK